MNIKAQELISSALQMPDEERALIAERLISSLDHPYDGDVEMTWQKEVQKRLVEIDEGHVELISWEQARRKLRGK
jgi:putative addiction module component (TIGR02574 family)